MNNLLFGDATFGYYETICGGSGATADHPGADAVHTHMTNTRLTDPEVFERRFPVRMREFAIRRGSGGGGRMRRRRRRRSTAGIPATARCFDPFATPRPLSAVRRRGRRAGRPRPQYACCEPTAASENCPDKAQFVAQPGDILIIETPGGGGFG